MRREKTKINKIRTEMGRSQQMPRKFRESLGATLKIYIQINWKTCKKTNFYTHVTIEN
jgi:hypothetical protein